MALAAGPDAGGQAVLVVCDGVSSSTDSDVASLAAARCGCAVTGLDYVPELLEHVRQGRIDPSFVVTHRLPLSEAAYGYHIFREKRDGCVKIVLDPAA